MQTKKINVWDPLVRIFHWALAITFFISYLSGDENEMVHIYSGYTILGLIVFRLIWGVVGTKYARFKQFIRSPKAALVYLKGLANKDSKEYIGHNPAGGWMVILMLTCLSAVTFSGLKVYALEEGKGLLSEVTTEFSLISKAHADDKKQQKNKHKDNESEEFWEDVHETSVNLMLILIFLHIAGVIISGKAHNINLVKAMISGEKTIKPD